MGVEKLVMLGCPGVDALARGVARRPVGPRQRGQPARGGSEHGGADLAEGDRWTIGIDCGDEVG